MTSRRTTLTFWQISDDLHQRISVGEYPAGAALPSVRDLARSYGVSVSTVQRAAMLLRDRRLVVGVPGRGIFVSDSPR